MEQKGSELSTLVKK